MLVVTKGLVRADRELLWHGLTTGLATAAGLRDPLDVKLPLLAHELLILHTEDLRVRPREAWACCMCSCCWRANTIGAMALSAGPQLDLALLL
jgi:hypothetical protein